MPDIYRYFRADYSSHSKTNAMLLAFPSLFVYSASIKWRGGFYQQYEKLMNSFAESDPFETEWFVSGGDAYDTQVCVMHNSRVVLIVFRGSASLTDWLNNFDFGWRSAPDGWGTGIKVHKGFYGALRSIYHDMRSHVRDLRHGRKVFVAGHSLGGALACLCGYRLQAVGGVDIQGVYSWGAPRVGNLAWAIEFNNVLPGRAYRWVRGHDFGPQVPDFAGTPSPPNQFIHAGQLNYIRPNGSVLMNTQDFEADVAATGANDHSMKRYLNFMISNLSTRQRNGPTDPNYLTEADVTAISLPEHGNKTLTDLIAIADG